MSAVDVVFRFCITLLYLLTLAANGRTDLMFEDCLDV